MAGWVALDALKSAAAARQINGMVVSESVSLSLTGMEQSL